MLLCAQNADSSDAAVSQPQMPAFMPFQQAGELVPRSQQGRGGRSVCRLDAHNPGCHSLDWQAGMPCRAWAMHVLLAAERAAMLQAWQQRVTACAECCALVEC
jgi:hypothetical protein